MAKKDIIFLVFFSEGAVLLIRNQPRLGFPRFLLARAKHIPWKTTSMKEEESGEREAPYIAALMDMGANVKIPKHTHAGVVSRSAHERY